MIIGLSPCKGEVDDIHCFEDFYDFGPLSWSNHDDHAGIVNEDNGDNDDSDNNDDNDDNDDNDVNDDADDLALPLD